MNSFALIGERLGHSYSKIIHERFFSLSGKDGLSYELIEIPRQSLESEFNRISKEYRGINVTIPYKTEIMPYLSDVSSEAKRIGAVNTVSFEDDAAVGYNTDYYGFKHSLDTFGIGIKGKKVIILGTGGASKAALCVCKDLGASDITFVSTKPKSDFNYRVISYSDKIQGDVLINCTPVGMYPNTDKSPLDKLDISFEAVVDMIYNPSVTVLMNMALSNGAKAINGLMMLVSQAVYAQALWNGQEVNGDIIDKIFNELREQ